MMRKIIQKADPNLNRKIMVQMKLDTKIPQFGTINDMQSFLRPEIVKRISPRALDGPFFTSVTLIRLHCTDDKITNDDNFFNSAFDSDDDLVHVCLEKKYPDRVVIR